MLREPNVAFDHRSLSRVRPPFKRSTHRYSSRPQYSSPRLTRFKRSHEEDRFSTTFTVSIPPDIDQKSRSPSFEPSDRPLKKPRLESPPPIVVTASKDLPQSTSASLSSSSTALTSSASGSSTTKGKKEKDIEVYSLLFYFVRDESSSSNTSELGEFETSVLVLAPVQSLHDISVYLASSSAPPDVYELSLFNCFKKFSKLPIDPVLSTPNETIHNEHIALLIADVCGLQPLRMTAPASPLSKKIQPALDAARKEWRYVSTPGFEVPASFRITRFLALDLVL